MSVLAAIEQKNGRIDIREDGIFVVFSKVAVLKKEIQHFDQTPPYDAPF